MTNRSEYGFPSEEMVPAIAERGWKTLRTDWLHLESPREMRQNDLRPIDLVAETVQCHLSTATSTLQRGTP